MVRFGLRSRIAGIMATKRTAELVPMCHPLALTHVSVEFEIDDAACAIDCTVTPLRPSAEIAKLPLLPVAVMVVEAPMSAAPVCVTSPKLFSVKAPSMMMKSG